MSHRYNLISFNSLIMLISILTASQSLAGKPKLQLATLYHSGLEVSEYFVSEKLDGVRGYWDGKRLLTRQGYRIDAPDWFIAPLPEQSLDGELWIGRGQFDKVSSLIRSSAARDNKERDNSWRRVKFMLFDMPQFPGAFSQRMTRLRRVVDEVDRDWIQLLPQRQIASESELMDWLEQVVAGGGEGLMLHHEDALYQQGRSTDLLKLKKWQDAEAIVIGYQPGRGKYAGMLGSLLVETADGMRFKLGTGFSDAQRKNPPAIGSQISYKYTGVSAKGVPRFASFLRVRR
ncbi:DNA ligase [Amphritea japonica]|uniref:DNA ligase (ATP) n=1 Tax=Amphritea japonica ATCC BAA-1530 TaxID=1278309 RepID=A0A7R6PHN4_9GAMM|nr:DNA ligase [Amphritea japonica]BBB26697.1 DNA ligase (ATP) [Amphritea japonica ATCC BAA-1530]